MMRLSILPNAFGTRALWARPTLHPGLCRWHSVQWLWSILGGSLGSQGTVRCCHSVVLSRSPCVAFLNYQRIFLTPESKVGKYPYMAFMDYVWLIKLIIELLKALAKFTDDELDQVARGIDVLKRFNA